MYEMCNGGSLRLPKPEFNEDFLRVAVIFGDGGSVTVERRQCDKIDARLAAVGGNVAALAALSPCPPDSTRFEFELRHIEGKFRRMKSRGNAIDKIRSSTKFQRKPSNINAEASDPVIHPSDSGRDGNAVDSDEAPWFIKSEVIPDDGDRRAAQPDGDVEAAEVEPEQSCDGGDGAAAGGLDTGAALRGGGGRHGGSGVRGGGSKGLKARE
ncbi:hypothetical protein C8R44DRAFT_732793 [Mycena epipterygia]|nr:hypothetical protein C8R44DRAFT_732793 [Mycena epipterygia]